MIVKYVKFWFPLIILFGLFSGKVKAQSMNTPRSIAMGGGGAAYISGFSSNFLNPANLLIPEHRFNNSIGLGQVALFLDKQPLKKTIKPYNLLYDQFTSQNTTNLSLTPEEHQKILSDWFPGDNNYYNRTGRFDAVLFGFNWQNGKHSYSLALRTRGINRVSIDRGWYESNFQNVNNKSLLRRNIRQTIAIYHELSFGFAQQFSMINGWSSHLNRLYIGIAPKLVFGGLYFKGNYQSEYSPAKNSQFLNVRNYHYIGTGQLSNILNGTSTSARNLNYQDALKPTGIGAGLDMGLTYVISLGNDTALLHRIKGRALKKSFRLSVSLTDIGFVRYNKNISSYQLPSDTIKVSQVPAGPNTDFIGSPGNFTKFIASDRSNKMNTPSNNVSHPKSHDVALPSALHFGSVLQLNWWMAAVDFTYGLNHNTFNSKYLITNIGGELRIIPFLPIRLGMQLQQTHNPIFGIGTALNLPHFEISTGFQLNTPGYRHNTYVLSSAVTAIQIRF